VKRTKGQTPQTDLICEETPRAALAQKGGPVDLATAGVVEGGNAPRFEKKNRPNKNPFVGNECSTTNRPSWNGNLNMPGGEGQ